MSTKEQQQLSLAARLCAVMGDCETVIKSGRNKDQNYTYVRESEIAEMLRRLLAKHGVFCLPTTEDIQENDIVSKSGTKGVFVRVRVKYTFINAYNPDERYESVHFGDASDYADKGLYKALTGCHKYMMMRTFCLGSEEDPESERDEAPTARDISRAIQDAGQAKANAAKVAQSDSKYPGTPVDYEVRYKLDPKAAGYNFFEWKNRLKGNGFRYDGTTMEWVGRMTFAFLDNLGNGFSDQLPPVQDEDDIPFGHYDQMPETGGYGSRREEV